MKKQKVFILGISGMLGHKLFTTICNHSYYEVYSSVRTSKSPEYLKKLKKENFIVHNLNIANLQKLENVIKTIKPDWVINCIQMEIAQFETKIKKKIPDEYLVADVSWRVVKLILGTAGLSNQWDGIIKNS